MRELTLQATVEGWEQVQTLIEETLEEASAPMQVVMQVSVCVEEIYVNIAHYAYYPQVGAVTIRCTAGENPSSITVAFEDSGVAFDPLAKEDADTTLSVEERQIGGLGILMVKKMMDEVSYCRTDGKNCLVMKKCWE